MKELLDSARQDMLQTADGQPIRNLCPAAASEVCAAVAFRGSMR